MLSLRVRRILLLLQSQARMKISRTHTRFMITTRGHMAQGLRLQQTRAMSSRKRKFRLLSQAKARLHLRFLMFLATKNLVFRNLAQQKLFLRAAKISSLKQTKELLGRSL